MGRVAKAVPLKEELPELKVSVPYPLEVEYVGVPEKVAFSALPALPKFAQVEPDPG